MQRLQKVIVTCDDTPAPVATLSSISISDYKTELTKGSAFDFGGTVTAHYSNGSTQDVTSEAEFTGYNMDVLGTYTVTVSYTESGETKTDQYTLTVKEPVQGEVYTLTIEPGDFNSTSYTANNGEHTSTATSASGGTKQVTWKSNQVMKQGSIMQWQKNTAYIESVTDLGTITGIEVESTDGTFTKTQDGGSFKVSVGNATGKTTKLTITFK